MIVYYTLIWNSINDNKVIVSKEPVMNMQFYINEVNLRNSGINLKIYGDIHHNSAKVVDDINSNALINNIPLLKSNLQKAVRRGDIDVAIISAYNLIIKNFWEFIRRLVIISIEDTSFLENTDFLVWCMLAYPNFDINNDIIQYLLTTVYAMTKSRKSLLIKKIDELPQINIEHPIKFPLLIRSEYGGLKGDMKMINYLCSTKITDKMIIKVPKKGLKITRGFYKRDIILESIDFHISKKLIPYVISKTDIKDPVLIKKIIWFNNSAYNIRKKSKIFETEKWELIKPYVKAFQNNYVIR